MATLRNHGPRSKLLVNVSRCDTDTHAHTLTHTHTHTTPPLLSCPVAMEPVAKAERYVFVMEVVDEADDHHHHHDDDDDDVHDDDNGLNE